MQQIMKKPISLLLILALILSMMPFMVDEVNAETQTLTSNLNLDSMTTSQDAIDTFGYHWNVDTKTLTLNNFKQIVNGDVGISSNRGFSIELIGENSISVEHTDVCYGIRAYNSADLNIKGNGSLNIYTNNTTADDSIGISGAVNSINIKDVTLCVDSQNYAVYTKYMLVDGGKFIANSRNLLGFSCSYQLGIDNAGIVESTSALQAYQTSYFGSFTLTNGAMKLKPRSGAAIGGITTTTFVQSLPSEYKYKISENDSYTEYSTTNGAEPYKLNTDDSYLDIRTANIEDDPIVDPTTPTPPSITPPATTPPTDTTKVPLKGDIIKSDTLNYKVTNPSTDGTGEITVYGFLPGMDKANLVIPKIYNYNGINYKVTAIGKRAFIRNKKLKKVKIGDNVKLIGFCAFYKCKNLKKVTIGSGLTKISNHVFCHDTKLKTIDIKSKKLKSVGKHVILKANNLKIKVPKSKVKKYKKLFKNKGQKKSAKVRVVKR